jgi:hypothetical protein
VRGQGQNLGGRGRRLAIYLDDFHWRKWDTSGV